MVGARTKEYPNPEEVVNNKNTWLLVLVLVLVLEIVVGLLKISHQTLNGNSDGSVWVIIVPIATH